MPLNKIISCKQKCGLLFGLISGFTHPVLEHTTDFFDTAVKAPHSFGTKQEDRPCSAKSSERYKKESELIKEFKRKARKRKLNI